jgi:hypothetical protein
LGDNVMEKSLVSLDRVLDEFEPPQPVSRKAIALTVKIFNKNMSILCSY